MIITTIQVEYNNKVVFFCKIIKKSFFLKIFPFYFIFYNNFNILVNFIILLFINLFLKTINKI